MQFYVHYFYLNLYFEGPEHLNFPMLKYEKSLLYTTVVLELRKKHDIIHSALLYKSIVKSIDAYMNIHIIKEYYLP